jgi:transposase-like protein
MANQHINYDEKMRLITECRQSGLSDHQWCIRNNISPSTFYTWISRIKNNLSIELPKSQAVTKVAKNAKQDIVQVNLLIL